MRKSGLIKWATMVVLGVTLSGCIVVPYGGRGRYVHGDRHHSNADGGQWNHHDSAREAPRRGR